MYKKTAIMLAVLATASTAFAQVSVSGALGFSYQKDRSNPAVHGMAMTDGHLTFKATENLGNGYSVTAQSEIASRGRDNTFAPRDATLGLLTPVGLLTVGSVESSNLLIARGWAGAPVSLPTGLDGGVIGGDQNIDVLAFYTKLGDLVVGASYSESGTSDLNALADQFSAVLTGNAAGNKVSGGPGGGSGPIQDTGISASYDKGGLSVGVGFSQTNVSANIADASALLLLKAGYDGRQTSRFTISYDFGMAKVGAGVLVRNKGWATETVFGVSVPLGAATIGLTYAAKTDDSATLGDGVTAGQAAGTLGFAIPTLRTADIKGSSAKSGFGIGMDYSLSKMTVVNASYGVYDVKNADRVNPVAPVSGSVTNEFRLRLMKSF